MNTGLSAAVHTSITVPAPIDRAFAMFADDISSWWPRDYHVGAQQMVSAHIEPRSGGCWYERSADGTICRWGDVIAYDPPYRLILSWAITVDWSPDPDASRASEIDVQFTPIDATSTRVDVDHRHFERHGPRGDLMRDAVGGDAGWRGILEQYAAHSTH